MGTDFPYLYRNSRAEAGRLEETQRHEDSFRLNVQCARAIEQAIRDHFNEADESLKDDCAQSVLEQYGFRRVNFVLANSLQEFKKSVCNHLVSDETYRWGKGMFIPSDGKYNRYYAVDTAAVLLESFIGQAREAYQALGLFGPEHCMESKDGLDYTGKVLVLSPDALKESCWSPRDQLWLAEGGFGCSPTATGRAVYATCLGDSEQARWNRADFTGILKDEFLPDWAREKLEELHAPKQAGPSMDGMS
ncbi:MAG: DUF3849 domain-containing protein [Oscillospiraceae bacterium]|nr:DUF3849 domain-containing protein [Oscillospiraceae bacterium]